jgi:hypothetical protein
MKAGDNYEGGKYGIARVRKMCLKQAERVSDTTARHMWYFWLTCYFSTVPDMRTVSNSAMITKVHS